MRRLRRPALLVTVFCVDFNQMWIATQTRNRARPSRSHLFWFVRVSALEFPGDAPHLFLVLIMLVLPNQPKAPGISRYHSAQVNINEDSLRRQLLRQCAGRCVHFLPCPLLSYFYFLTDLLGKLCMHLTHFVVARATRV